MKRIRELLTIEGPTLVAMVVVLLVVEVAFRGAGDRLSGDVAHLQEIDEIVGDLAAAPGLHVLFVGNSLIGEGLDAGALASALTDSLGAEVDVAVARPDGTSPLEWYYLLDRYVFDRGRTPDLLVVPFGPGHLFDRDAREAVLRLAAHHVASDEIAGLFSTDLPTFEARAQFLLARGSRAFALRDRVQPRVLDLMIPGYRELAPLILQAGGGAGAGGPAVAPSRSRTLDHLERITARASAENVPVLFVAMPQGAPWTMDPAVRAFLSERDQELLDFRSVLDLPSERFPDGEHMDSQGRERFTRMLSVEMLPTVRRVSVRPRR